MNTPGCEHYIVSALSEAYHMLSESPRLSFQIFSQSPATELKCFTIGNQVNSISIQVSNKYY